MRLFSGDRIRGKQHRRADSVWPNRHKRPPPSRQTKRTFLHDKHDAARKRVARKWLSENDFVEQSAPICTKSTTTPRSEHARGSL